MEATKQLILRLPPEIHKEFKMLSVLREKTMTNLLIEWIKGEVAHVREDPFISQLKSMPITHEEVSPEMMAEIEAAMKETPEGSYDELSKELFPKKKK